jgi:hypothetical protein
MSCYISSPQVSLPPFSALITHCETILTQRKSPAAVLEFDMTALHHFVQLATVPNDPYLLDTNTYVICVLLISSVFCLVPFAFTILTLRNRNAEELRKSIAAAKAKAAQDKAEAIAKRAASVICDIAPMSVAYFLPPKADDVRPVENCFDLTFSLPPAAPQFEGASTRVAVGPDSGSEQDELSLAFVLVRVRPKVLEESAMFCLRPTAVAVVRPASSSAAPPPQEAAPTIGVASIATEETAPPPTAEAAAPPAADASQVASSATSPPPFRHTLDLTFDASVFFRGVERQQSTPAQAPAAGESPPTSNEPFTAEASPPAAAPLAPSSDAIVVEYRAVLLAMTDAVSRIQRRQQQQQPPQVTTKGEQTSTVVAITGGSAPDASADDIEQLFNELARHPSDASTESTVANSSGSALFIQCDFTTAAADVPAAARWRRIGDDAAIRPFAIRRRGTVVGLQQPLDGSSTSNNNLSSSENKGRPPSSKPRAASIVVAQSDATTASSTSESAATNDKSASQQQQQQSSSANPQSASKQTEATKAPAVRPAAQRSTAATEEASSPPPQKTQQAAAATATPQSKAAQSPSSQRPDSQQSPSETGRKDAAGEEDQPRPSRAQSVDDNTSHAPPLRPLQSVQPTTSDAAPHREGDAVPTVVAVTRPRHVDRQPRSLPPTEALELCSESRVGTSIDPAPSEARSNASVAPTASRRGAWATEPSPEPSVVPRPVLPRAHPHQSSPSNVTPAKSRFDVGDVLQRTALHPSVSCSFGGRVGTVPVGGMVCVQQVIEPEAASSLPGVEPTPFPRYHVLGGKDAPRIDIRPFFAVVSSLSENNVDDDPRQASPSLGW